LTVTITESAEFYLPAELPRPAPTGLDADFWSALDRDELTVQECQQCGNRQPPEWICHACHSFDLAWVPIAPTGSIYTWERVWAPSHPALRERLPYLVILAELDDAPGVRLVGNLLGDPMQDVKIGASVRGVFEHHDGYTLMQWEA
jgi:uncharacterized protein